jgi:hypothetical protein
MVSHTRVVEAIDAGAREIREDAALQIKRIEARRDLDLARFKQAKLILGGNADPGAGSAEHEKDREGRPEAPPKRQRTRRRKRLSTAVRSVAERREQVFRFIGESGGSVSSGELVKGTGISIHAVHTALQQLLKERKIIPLGTSAATRYALRTGIRSVPARDSIVRGTLQGRVIATIDDRSYVTAEELGQALGEPAERMVEVCAGLQAEGEIRMERRGGKPVYVLQAA